MLEFLSTEEFSISKSKEDNTLFTIEFQTSCESLISSMIKTKLIIASSISDDYKTFSFRASSVKSFKKFISNRENINYQNTLKIIVSLCNQVQYLITIKIIYLYKYVVHI